MFDRLGPALLPVSLVELIWIHWLLGGVAVGGQDAIALHFANIFISRPEARHIEALDL